MTGAAVRRYPAAVDGAPNVWAAPTAGAPPGTPFGLPPRQSRRLSDRVLSLGSWWCSGLLLAASFLLLPLGLLLLPAALACVAYLATRRSVWPEVVGGGRRGGRGRHGPRLRGVPQP